MCVGSQLVGQQKLADGVFQQGELAAAVATKGARQVGDSLRIAK